MSQATRNRPEASGIVPPHDLDAEQSVLGSILLAPAAIEEVLEFLRPEDFYRQNNGVIYEAALKLYAKNEPIDNVTLAATLSAMETLDRIGGRTQLASLQMAVPTAANVAHYGRIVKQHSLRRRLASAATDIAKLAREESSDVDVALQQAQQLLFALAEDDQVDASDIEQVIASVIRAYEDHAPGTLNGLSTGFMDVDDMLNGLAPGELYIVAARPNMGKTSWMLQVCRNVAQQVPVGIFTLEMSKEQLAIRVLCQDARVDAKRYMRGSLSPTEYDQVMRAAGPLGELTIKMDDSSPLDELRLLHRARQMVRRHRVGLIAIDYLQLLNAHHGQPDNRVAEVTAISKGLKEMAKMLRVPVLAVSQLSRAPESRVGDHRPRMSDLRESGALEQDATAVAFLYRPEYYKGGDSPGICEVIIGKNRYGPTGTVELVFRSQFTRFENKAREVRP